MAELQVQLRVDTKSPKDGFEWQVVVLRVDDKWGRPPDPAVDWVLVSGKSHDLDKALDAGGKALVKEAWSPDPCRHEWDCDCGARLVIEARRSRRSPYSWDSPRELTCSCGRSYGVKLNFAAGRSDPFIEALPR